MQKKFISPFFFIAAALAASLATMRALPVQAECNPYEGEICSGGGHTSYMTVNVVTHVENDDGGALLPSHFLMSYGDGLSTSSSWAGVDAPGFYLVASPGAYVVTGPDAPGYVRTYSSGCSGTLPDGGSATCLVTYDDADPVVRGCEETGDCVTDSSGDTCEDTNTCASADSSTSTDENASTTASTQSSSAAVTTSSSSASGSELPRTGNSALPAAFALLVAARPLVLLLRKRS